MLLMTSIKDGKKGQGSGVVALLCSCELLNFCNLKFFDLQLHTEFCLFLSVATFWNKSNSFYFLLYLHSCKCLGKFGDLDGSCSV